MTTDTSTEGPHTKRQIREMLQALEITRVINVDDDHAEAPEQSLEQVLGALRAGTVDHVLVARLVFTNDGDVDAESLESDEVVEALESRWDALGDEHRAELTQAASRAEQADEGPVDEQSEAVASNNAALLALPDLFEEHVTYLRLSLTEWRTTGQALLDDGERTLLLFDRSFEREGGSATAGDDLVRGILNRDDLQHVYVGLLTHTAKDTGREANIAAEISEGSNPSRPVIVVAKRRLSDESFPEALRLVLFAAELEAFRKHAITSLTEASTAGTRVLEEVDKYLLLASFEAARHEGAYEADFALRMANAFVRRSLTAALRDEQFIDNVLIKLRNAAGIKLYFEGRSAPDEVFEISWQEKFDDSDYLTKNTLPVEVGDVFKARDMFGNGKSRGAPRFYILLAQACDLSVRSDGKRGNDLNRVVITEIRRASQDPETGSYRALKTNQANIGPLLRDSSAPWRVFFTQQIEVPILALDATVAGPGGRALLSQDGPPPKTFSASWLQRRVRMQKEAKSLIDRYRAMECTLTAPEKPSADFDSAKRHILAAVLGTATKHAEGLSAKVDVDQGIIEYGIERVARVSEATARGLLSLLLQHQSRPAFESPLFLDHQESQ
ncbi:hypothetical protein AB0P21_12870 [Kribbella sp. NPDC056861]|uniref:hypothetical protein n=1 Tax=Kribbella sp. NPDC056861 TaxID=3154857 RepID=UPI0034176C0D